MRRGKGATRRKAPKSAQRRKTITAGDAADFSLTRELQDSLERLSATSEILKLISESSGDLQPVFAAILENATRICGAKIGILFRYDEGAYTAVATQGVPPAYAEYLHRGPICPGPTTGLGRVAITRGTIHVVDTQAEGAYSDREPLRVATVELGRARSLLNVPMLKGGTLIGAIGIYRLQVRPFSDKEIELVTNFAAQAVIAIENTRLLHELRDRTEGLTESLRQQTATGKILHAISNPKTEIGTVFDAILDNCVGLCGGDRAVIWQSDGHRLRLAGGKNTTPEAMNFLRDQPLELGPHNPTTLAGLEHRTVHEIDVFANPAYRPLIPIRTPAPRAPTVLAVPLLRQNELLGVITIWRHEKQLFTNKQVELVETFASQAVIAIENTRLLKELRERTDQLANLNQQLEQRVAEQVGEIERMSRLRRFLPPQVADLIVASGAEGRLESHRSEIAALFCDLRGFTGFAESSDPEDVIALLRDYHAAIGSIINRYGGTLERFAGDGVMVVFNDPVPVDRPALQAVLMAIELRAAIGELIEKWRKFGHDIGYGIGIAHGFATLGTIGFEGRFDYSAIGTVCNVASRLCDEAKSGQILISPRVLSALGGEIPVEQVGEFELKGIRRPVVAYNVLSKN